MPQRSQFILLKAIAPKRDKFVVRCVGLIVIVSPVTRRPFILQEVSL